MNTPAQGLPDGPLLAYYGDDFTGSTDLMESFTAAGVPTVLLLDPAALANPERFAGARCIGLAGIARGKDPAWMDRELPAAFDALARLGAPILQYKVCSTFDSSPAVGSIGRAIDLGSARMGGRWSPSVVGVSRLGRYQVFGNLFAAAQGTVHRIDRHPTMSRHPVTPMDEADLRAHLARQTTRRIELIDLADISAGRALERLRTLAGDDAPVVFIDVLDDATQRAAGELVWEQRGTGVFSASSSGLQYALAAYWRSRGWLPAAPGLPVAEPVDVIAAVSGSCSPVTASQVAWARAHGFHVERLRIAESLGPARDAEVTRLVDAAVASLGQGTSALVHSAEGPDDPDVTGFGAHAAAAGLSRPHASERIARTLADVMRGILDRVPLKRVVVAGGDSSGEVAGRLGIDALTACAAMAPGAPLCRAWSRDPRRDGLEIALKGGQIGAPSFFGDVRAGRVISV